MLPMGRYKGCKRNISGTPGLYQSDGCTLYAPHRMYPMYCARCGCNISYHRVSSDNNVNPPATVQTGGGGGGGGGGSTTSNNDLVQNTGQAAAALPLDLNVPPGTVVTMLHADLLTHPPKKGSHKPHFTETQSAAMKDYAERLGWSLAVSGSPKDQLELDAFCDGIGVSRKQFVDWVSNNKKYYREAYWATLRGQSSSQN